MSRYIPWLSKYIEIKGKKTNLKKKYKKTKETMIFYWVDRKKKFTIGEKDQSFWKKEVKMKMVLMTRLFHFQSKNKIQSKSATW